MNNVSALNALSAPSPTPSANDSRGDSGGFGDALRHAHGNHAGQGRTPAEPHQDGDRAGTVHADGRAGSKSADASQRQAARPADGHDDDKRSDDATAPAPLVPGLPMPPLRPVSADTGKNLPPAAAAIGVHAGRATAAAADARQHGTTAPAADAAGAAATAAGASPDAALPGDALATAGTALRDAAHERDGGSPQDFRSELLAASPHTAAPAQTAHTPAAAAPQTTPHLLDIGSAPGSAQFGQDLGQHVVWLSGQDLKQARIQLHPRDLGPVNVDVKLHNDRVDVSFAVQHPGTVHALQQTLPQLDSMLAQHGLSLGQAQVDQQQAGHPQGSGGHTGGSGPVAAGEDDIAATATTIRTPVRAVLGAVDEFA